MSIVDYLSILAFSRTSCMRIKKSEYTETLYTRISKHLDDYIIQYCTEHNKSKSEFVRDAVEYYIKQLYITDADIQEAACNIISNFDKQFDNEFFNN